jgi:hypothetical protein
VNEEEWIHPTEHGVAPAEPGGWVVIGEWRVQGLPRNSAPGLCAAVDKGHGLCLALPNHEHPHFCCHFDSPFYISAVQRRIARPAALRGEGGG